MSKYTVTVIKTGNSYALRVPKTYVDNSKLTLGQKIQLDKPLMAPKKHSPSAIKKAIKSLQQINAYPGIKDPVSWQKDIRKDRKLPGRE